MSITISPWGKTRKGESASRYLLKNVKGMELELSNFGALILAIRIPVLDEKRDVVLGFDTLGEYYSNGPGFGAYVGRNGNRIANASVEIEGSVYALDANDNGNNLHSGFKRSYYEFYETALHVDEEAPYIEFSRLSPHLEQGFPGNLLQRLRYTLTSANELKIDYFMQADKATVINPTNHSYFNLMGQNSGDIGSHRMQILAEHFLPTDKALIPTGELASVEGTPMDFREPKRLGLELGAAYEPLIIAGGYDHNYCLDNNGKLEKAAVLEAPDGSLKMTVFTDRPGLQVYSGNFLGGEKGKGGAVYSKRSGICFESQAYPNACKEPFFQTSIVPANTPFHSQTVYQFSF